MPRRVHLPVLLDRRVVLRGVAAALVAALSGCRIALDNPQQAGDPGPDAGDQGMDDAVVGSGFERCGDTLCFDLAHPANASLNSIDGARTLTFESKKLIVIRVAETEFVVLSAICTHTGCTVRYAPAREHIECPCHGSTFALDGHVTRGPAGTPLAQFAATLDATTGIVSIEI